MFFHVWNRVEGENISTIFSYFMYKIEWNYFFLLGFTHETKKKILQGEKTISRLHTLNYCSLFLWLEVVKKCFCHLCWHNKKNHEFVLFFLICETESSEVISRREKMSIYFILFFFWRIFFFYIRT